MRNEIARPPIFSGGKSANQFGGKPKLFLISIFFLVFSFFFSPLTTHHSPFTNEVYAALSCDSCHGTPGQYNNTGLPDYPSTANKKNSHVAHSGYGCEKCHVEVSSANYTITYATNHVNGTYNVKGSKDLGYQYIASGSSCTTPGCHSATYWGGPKMDCMTCHKSSVTISGVGARRAIVADATTTANWGHFRANYAKTTIVTSTDCAVCHMEGKMSGNVGSVEAAYHNESPTNTPVGNFQGFIQLRNPDTNAVIQFSTWNGIVAGVAGSSWTRGVYRDSSTWKTGYLYKVEAGSFSFVKFSRSTATAALEPWVTSVQNNHCLKCHDADYASNASARPAGETAVSPFIGTGPVVNVSTHFATTNASYHPVIGPQNNPFCDTDTLHIPWNTVKKSTWGTSGWGSLISCWDCHIDTSPATRRPWTHGGGKTSLRAAYNNFNVTTDLCAAGPTALCVACHKSAIYGAATETAGQSAFGLVASHITNHFGETSMRCGSCHSSSWFYPGRSIAAADAHGFNLIYSSANATTGIPTGSPTLATYVDGGVRPFCFLRNTANRDTATPFYWTGWQPRNVGGTAYTPGCYFRGSNTTTACDGGRHSTTYPGWEVYNSPGYGGWYSNATPPP